MRHRSHITQPGFRKGIPSPNKGKRFRSEVLTNEEVLALIEQCNCGVSGLRDRALIAAGWGTGGRISELLALRVSDIDLKTGAVHINGTKTRNAVRVVGLNPTCRAIVRDWIDVRAELNVPLGSPLFCCISKHELGNPMGSPQFRQKLYRLREKAGIEKRVHCHALRHTFAVELKRAGVDIRLISKALGHSNIAITHIYLDHIDPSEVIAATNGLNLTGSDIYIDWGMA
jgi:site-specific recombinase XerD